MIKYLIILLFIIFYLNKFWLFLIFILIYYLLFIIINLNFSIILLNLRFRLGLDFLNFSIISLIIWLFVLIILSRRSFIYKNFNNIYIYLLLFIVIILSLTFISLNIFKFYLFFERRIIPILFLIIGWGYQPERIQAGIYLLFYTIIASLPMLISIFIYFKIFNSLNILNIKILFNLYIYLSINFIFIVKFPIFIFHLWLPKAHVEAPVSGSMILAGIILKLGRYGIIRIIIIFSNYLKINLLFVRLRLLGGFIISLICLRQLDIKSLIAYSSVSHIRLVLAGIIRLNYLGIIGRVIIIIAHGLCSSGLFSLLNISYERTNRRRIFLNKGLINLIPRLRLFWFLLLRRNISAPPSLNLLGEVILLSSLIRFNKINILLLIFIRFFRVVYSLYLFSYRQHGNFYRKIKIININNIREYILLFIHWLPLNLIILKINFLYLNSLIKYWFVGSKL